MKNNLPDNIAIFPLSNAVFFPKTILPLNIFEDRYLQLVSDCMKEGRMFGMVQPKSKKNEMKDVYKVGCLGKITSFNETADKRFIINLSGIIRFRIKKETDIKKLYRKFDVDYSEFLDDLKNEDNKINYTNKVFFKKIKLFFGKLNYPIDYNELGKLNADQLVSTICMIAPFSTEEKQKIIEAVKIENKIQVLDEIINFKLFEIEEIKTIQ